ncbi:MAG: endoribonuclease MazF [Acetobacteraceae bacterium]|nr:endoribonuclease MazF [Acetobacteraceae bacterium]
MTPPGYVPESGDIVWLEFDPQAGHEQAGHRPAVVLSPAGYNGRTGLVLCCPATTRIKGYPFEVPIAGSPPSVVLADQVKCQDWRARKAVRKGRVATHELAEIRAKLKALIGWGAPWLAHAGQHRIAHPR